jgi:hypothetical protein
MPLFVPFVPLFTKLDESSNSQSAEKNQNLSKIKGTG